MAEVVTRVLAAEFDKVIPWEKKVKKSELTMIAYKAIDRALESCTAGNPLEVWTHFVDILDAAGRQKIGDELQYAGKNRYTGEEQEDGNWTHT